MKWYLAGPFWDQECKEFYDNFISRIRENSITNRDFADDGDGNIVGLVNPATELFYRSEDSIFHPGHYVVDFNKIKKEYSPSDMKRVLKQILDLDLNNIGDGLVVWAKGYDLGTMFELGYYLSGMVQDTNISTYNELKKRLIIEKGDEKLYESIDYVIRFVRDIVNRLVDYSSNTTRVMVVDGINSIKNYHRSKDDRTFNLMAIRMDNWSDDPFNSLMAGVAYSRGIPFISYSTNEAKSNTMMLAASMGHMKLGLSKLEKVERSAIDWVNNISKNIWSDENINYAKDIK